MWKRRFRTPSIQALLQNPSCAVGMRTPYENDCILGLHMVLISLDWESGNCWPRKLGNSESDWKLVDRRISPAFSICLDSFLLDSHPLVHLVTTLFQVPYYKHPSPTFPVNSDALQCWLVHREIGYTNSLLSLTLSIPASKFWGIILNEATTPSVCTLSNSFTRTLWP
jgi:hypothetical protein